MDGAESDAVALLDVLRHRPDDAGDAETDDDADGHHQVLEGADIERLHGFVHGRKITSAPAFTIRERLAGPVGYSEVQTVCPSAST